VTAAPITGKQMKRLLTLWGLLCRQANLDATDRQARLTWISDAIGRTVSSIKELSVVEGRTVIDAIQKHLPPELLWTKRPRQSTARAYGTAGRRGQVEIEIPLVDAETLQLIDRLLQKLGWTRERFDLFLRSPKSPVRSGMIRTLAEANRVTWALKRMARRAA